MSAWLLYIGLGAFAGVLAGLLGVGGGLQGDRPGGEGGLRREEK